MKINFSSDGAYCYALFWLLVSLSSSLIVNEEKYCLITTMANRIVDRQVKPSDTDPKNDGRTRNFECIKLSRAQHEKIRYFQIQEETDEQLKEKIFEAVQMPR